MFAGVAMKALMTGGATTMHAPEEQIWFSPHEEPSGLLPVDVHVPGCDEDRQAIEPLLHGFAGWQAVPGTHSLPTHDPRLQTSPAPHVVPSALLPEMMQLGTAIGVEHELVPIVQGFVGWHT
jgi:hypothetical protein